MEPIGFSKHDHKTCIKSAIQAAEETCRASSLQFTPVRKRVLEILLEEHRALGAYDILERLRQEGMGSQPPVAYRALDFLTKHKFAHKIERLNAFIACAHPNEPHTPAFFICRNCSFVAEAETDPTQGRLAAIATSSGFVIEQAVMEAEGICSKCAPEANA
jgi:Fur family zinc uptake transcriptional regulator